ncbi:MAG: hypothetical protein P1Q69_10285, partial [Candidatus Thorarchaeota archaeon]|nr:hypothetical protein [Candidatus Thorarchaeota archaeon]
MVDSEGAVQKSFCVWCGKRIAKGYHGDSKSLFMKRYRFYCSIKCKEADSLPDWACFPVLLIPFQIFLVIFMITTGRFTEYILQDI